MPTYYATGVTATLATCDLQASLSNTFDWLQGAEQQTDAKRIQCHFSTARKLPERPVGEDGSEKGVVQFLGVDQDIPFYVVEAGDKVGGISSGLRLKGDTFKGPTRSLSGVPSFSDDSPLTSLGVTPTPTPQSFNESPSKSAPATNDTLERALRSLPNPSAQQALVLDVNVSHRSFLPASSKGGASTGKDVKLEVFVNGQLADVSFVNARHSAVQLTKDKARFSGMRVHRQVEKPWVYAPADYDAGDDFEDAGRRWADVSESLRREAEIRGRDVLGNTAPSAEFLSALAALPLPERLRGQQGIGVFDIVFTAGKGKKHGPETTYLTCPTRMRDPEFSPSTLPLFPMLSESENPFDGPENDSPLHNLPSMESSPEIPLRNLSAVTPSPRRTIDLEKDLGLDLDLRKTNIGNFETVRGKVGSGRSLKQRLGDLKKMSPAKQTQELDRLRAELGGGEEAVGPVKKKVKLDKEQEDDVLGGPQMLANAAPSPEEPLTMNPMDVLKDPSVIDPLALLTQTRIDMALGEGASSNGDLLRRIASTSPQRTALKTTRASALANSPTSTPVKQKQPPKTPRRNKTPIDSSPLSSFTSINATPALNATPSRSGRGADRTARKWAPGEQTVAQALQGFEVPEACKGSCVSYAEGEKEARQIGKARNGDFSEEQVVVGMRFVVV